MPVVVLTGAHGSDTAENCGGAEDAALLRLWTSLCSCSDKFPGLPGGASELFIDKMFKF